MPLNAPKRYPTPELMAMPQPLRNVAECMKMHIEAAQRKGGRILMTELAVQVYQSIELTHAMIPREVTPELKQAFVDVMASEFGLDIDGSQVSTLWAALKRVADGGHI